MTLSELRQLKTRIIEASTAAFVAIEEAMQTSNETTLALTEELNTASTMIAELTAQLNNANNTIEGFMVPIPTILSSPIRAAMEISMDFNIQPTIPSTLPTVRFLSKSSAMGGLANIRAQMNDIGINAKRMRLEGSTYVPSRETLVINWGGGFELPITMANFAGRHLNKLIAIKIAANKLKTFEALSADEFLKDYIPAYATSLSQINEVLPPTQPVYVRTDLYGHSGQGIQVIPVGSNVTVQAPLYVEGLNVKHEYRVHVVNGFTKIQKKARLDTENPNMEIRNLDGGWTFINDFSLGDRGRSELHQLSNKIITCLGLNFGAVDIVRTEEGTWKVLEVNTAPGITAESNIEWYTKALLSNLVG